MRNGGFPTAIGLLVLVAILAPHPARTAPLRDGDDDGQYFRPPTIPFATFAPMHQKHVLATSTAATSLQKGASTKYWLGQDMPIGLALRFGASGVVPLLGGDVWPTASSRGGQTHCDDWRLGSGIDFIWVGVQPKAADVGPLITRLGYDVYVVDLRHACSDRCSFDALHLCEQGATLMARANVSTYHKAIDEEFIMIQPIVMVDIHVDLIGITEPVSVYMDFGAQNAIHLFEKANASEEVTWKTGNTTVSGAQWASLGTVKQPVLESCGDLFMLDWGYGYIGSYSPNAITTGGHTMNTTRALFSSTGQLPPTLTSPTSRAAFDPQTGDVVATAVMEDISSSRHTTFFIGYDEGPIMDYFGEKILPRWSRNGTISYLDALDAMTQRSGLIPHMEVLQEQLEGSFSALGGRYQRIANMAYRQTAAAIEFGYSELIGRDVAFLKEISTDGDINTMDVIFPASPMLIFLSGNTLKELLIPVLHFAANLTSHPYSSPYSPHQLGIYPIANATTASQEVMPLENTGNMIVMIQALTNGNPGETFYFKPWDNKTKYNPYWGVLSHWVDYLMTTQLPDPPKQTTTDDFAGPLDHDVNLAGKGVIAVHAFGELCKMAAGDVNPANGRPCSDYTAAAEGFAKFWVEHATETDLDTGLTYTKLAFDQNRTWSTKYNLVWQRLLKNATRYETDGVFGRHPFATLNATAANEVRLYETRFNEYGYPLDSRHSYQKLDWLTWGACLCRTQSCFLRFFDGVYRMANQTAERYPLTDLYNTHHATMVYAFVSRPVVGAVFMPLLLDWDQE